MPQRRRILVVEDDADTSGAISELLTRAGYADAVFHKPCDLNDVLEAVRRLAPAGMTSDG